MLAWDTYVLQMQNGKLVQSFAYVMMRNFQSTSSIKLSATSIKGNCLMHICFMVQNLFIFFTMYIYKSPCFIFLRCCNNDLEIMKFTSDRRKINCVSKVNPMGSNSHAKCSFPYKKIDLHGKGMPEHENFRRGKLSDDGYFLGVRFKKNMQGSRVARKTLDDFQLPLNFSDYCVSMFKQQYLL